VSTRKPNLELCLRFTGDADDHTWGPINAIVRAAPAEIAAKPSLRVLHQVVSQVVPDDNRKGIGPRRALLAAGIKYGLHLLAASSSSLPSPSQTPLLFLFSRTFTFQISPQHIHLHHYAVFPASPRPRHPRCLLRKRRRRAER
jgi:hypothetical protein